MLPEFTVKVISEVAGMEPLQFRAMFRRLGYKNVPDETFLLTSDTIIKLWIFMLVTRLKFLSSEQRTMLSEELNESLDAEATTGILAQPTPMVVIADSRYATWYKRSGWLDLTNGETVEAPRVPPLETVAFNLAVLCRRNQAACEEITRRKATDNASDPG